MPIATELRLRPRRTRAARRVRRRHPLRAAGRIPARGKPERRGAGPRPGPEADRRRPRAMSASPAIEPVGNYAVRLMFDDLHDTGHLFLGLPARARARAGPPLAPTTSTNSPRAELEVGSRRPPARVDRPAEGALPSQPGRSPGCAGRHRQRGGECFDLRRPPRQATADLPSGFRHLPTQRRIEDHAAQRLGQLLMSPGWQTTPASAGTSAAAAPPLVTATGRPRFSASATAMP